MDKPTIKIVNTHKVGRGTGEYIGRGSPLGNPFSHQRDTKAQYLVKTRGEAIRCYRDWLAKKVEERDRAVLAELRRLYDLAVEEGELTLRCFCVPRACHGEVIKEFLEKAFERLLPGGLHHHADAPGQGGNQ